MSLDAGQIVNARTGIGVASLLRGVESRFGFSRQRTWILDRLPEIWEELIEAGFSDVDTPTPVTTPYVEAHNTSVYAQYTVEVPNRDAVQAAMIERSIPTAVHYPRPLHLQPAFADLRQGPGSFRAAEEAAERVISLPMHAYLTDEQQRTVIHALKDSVLEVL